MSPVRKKKKDPVTALLQGLTAVSVTAAVLATAVFLLISREPGRSAPPQEPETTVQTYPAVTLPANPFGPSDFTYENGYLTCTTGTALPGVDVSAHQGSVDWEQVRSAGMEFAMIRLGYRGYTTGGVYADEYAQENLNGARAAGLKLGGYFYSQALTPEEAIQEARACIHVLEGMELDLPVVFDWEYVSETARTGGMDRDTLMACAEAFCRTIEAAGYEAMIYFNPSLAESLLELERLTEYPWWLAMYSDQMSWPYAVEMWQYTASGTVPGIEGDVDINLWFPQD